MSLDVQCIFVEQVIAYMVTYEVDGYQHSGFQVRNSMGFPGCLCKKGPVEESCVGGLDDTKIWHMARNARLYYLNIGTMDIGHEKCSVHSCV